MKTVYRLLIVVFSLFAIVIIPLEFSDKGYAGDNDNNVVTILKSYDNVVMIWSTDSQRLAYQENQSNWYVYNVSQIYAVSEAVEYDSFPLQPALTQEEHTYFAPENASIIYESPDQEYLLFTGLIKTPETTRPLKIANRVQQEVYTTQFLTRGAHHPQPFKVLWSENSETFVITYHVASEFSSIQFGSNYANNITDIMLTGIELPSVIPLFYPGDGAYDISSDGRRVLLRATLETEILNPYDFPKRLIVWQPNNPEASIVIDSIDAEYIIGGAFDPDDENQILFMSNEGIFRHHLITEETTRLNSEIRSTGIEDLDWEEALFSPDGRWLAFRKMESDDMFTVNLVELSQVIPPASEE